jgi:glycosyltransferase involved in cell wall biosynthesis
MNTVLMIVLNNFINDSRVLRECSSVCRMGYRVIVFALHEGDLPESEENPDYALFRIKLKTRGWSKHTIIQMIKYFECFFKMVLKGRKISPKIVHCHDVSALPIGFIISHLIGAKLIYDSHELWSQYVRPKSIVFRMFSYVSVFLERWLMRRADAIITVADSIADYIAEHSKIKKPFVIRNIAYSYKPKSNMVNLLKRDLQIPSDKKILIFQGGQAANIRLESLIEAMGSVVTEGVLVFLGDGPIKSDLQNIAKGKPFSDRIFFHDTVDYNVLIDYTSGASIGIVLSSSSNLSYRLTLPIKLFEYIQARIPIIAVDLPEISRITKEYGLGETFPEKDFASFANIANKLLTSPEVYMTYKDNVDKSACILNWENEEKKLQMIYRNL